MTDEDTGAPLGSNLRYEGKDLFHLVYGKRRRRLVQDDDRGVEIHRPGYRQALAFSPRQRPHAGVGMHPCPIQPQNLLQNLRRRPFFRPNVDKAKKRRQGPANKHVPPQRLQFPQRTLLIDRLHPHAPGGPDPVAPPIDPFAPYLHPSFIGPVKPRKNLDEGGLPRPIVPQQGQDFSPTKLQIDSVQGGYRTEGFPYSPHRDNSLHKFSPEGFQRVHLKGVHLKAPG